MTPAVRTALSGYERGPRRRDSVVASIAHLSAGPAMGWANGIIAHAVRRGWLEKSERLAYSGDRQRWRAMLDLTDKGVVALNDPNEL